LQKLHAERMQSREEEYHAGDHNSVLLTRDASSS
jgi:hypothetical protein